MPLNGAVEMRFGARIDPSVDIYYCLRKDTLSLGLSRKHKMSWSSTMFIFMYDSRRTRAREELSQRKERWFVHYDE